MRSYLFPQVQLNETFTVGMRGRAKISMRLVQETIQASTPSEGPSANPSLLELHVWTAKLRYFLFLHQLSIRIYIYIFLYFCSICSIIYFFSIFIYSSIPCLFIYSFVNLFVRSFFFLLSQLRKEKNIFLFELLYYVALNVILIRQRYYSSFEVNGNFLSVICTITVICGNNCVPYFFKRYSYLL